MQALAAQSHVLSLLKTISIGLKPGEYGGRKRKRTSLRHPLHHQTRPALAAGAEDRHRRPFVGALRTNAPTSGTKKRDGY